MPRIRLKPLSQQTIVLTGATSGIGLATARMAARHGARLFLIARNEDALETLQDELAARGTEVGHAVADVADQGQVEAAAGKAVGRFGQIDTWVNDAGAFIYGRLDEVPMEDQRRLFDVDYWGVVHGSLAAASRLRRTGGAIINIGSVLGEIAIPIQGTYCAAKFAVKGFTEAFRREVEQARQPISVTLIKPAGIDTTFMEHARNLTGAPGTRNPPPAYHPHLVARAILHAATHPMRDIMIGGTGGAAMVAANTLAPRVVDWLAARLGRAAQTTKRLGDPARRDSLYQPRADLAERSSLRPWTRRTSLLLEAQLNPAVTMATLAGLGVVLSAMQRRPNAARR